MPDRPPRSISSPPRRKALLTLLSLGAVLGVFMVATVVSRRLFESDSLHGRRPVSVTTPTSLNPDPDNTRFRVTGVQGQVECWQDGKVQRLHAGDLLSQKDIIRTPPGTRVILCRGNSEIELREKVEIQLEHMAVRAATFDVYGGSDELSATVEGKDEPVVITAAGTRAESAGPFRWVVALDEGGKVAVTVAHGQVQLCSDESTVEMGAGIESGAGTREPPSKPIATPEEFLLSVIWPEIHGGREHPALHKRTRPSARLSVNRQAVSADTSGRSSVPLSDVQPGRIIKVRARDAFGRETNAKSQIKDARQATRQKVSGEELWKE